MPASIPLERAALEPGSYEYRVRFTFAREIGRGWQGTQAQWDAARFWSGTVESGSFRLNVPQGHYPGCKVLYGDSLMSLGGRVPKPNEQVDYLPKGVKDRTLTIEVFETPDRPVYKWHSENCTVLWKKTFTVTYQPSDPKKGKASPQKEEQDPEKAGRAVKGIIKKVSGSGPVGEILVENSRGLVCLIVNEKTEIVHANQQEAAFADLKVGLRVNARTDIEWAASDPPQTVAYSIVIEDALPKSKEKKTRLTCGRSSSCPKITNRFSRSAAKAC